MFDRMERVDVLALGAHPDDVEIGCGGLLALCAERGLRTGIVHLTRGEAGTRGTAEVRAREAAAAASVLGAELEILDFGDGGLRTGRREEDRLIRLLREARPRLVVGPSPEDRHPDHERACRLVRDACFYAGLRGRPDPAGLAAHRPSWLLEYPLHDQRPPDLVIDLEGAMSRKVEALRCHASQLSLADESGKGRETAADDGASDATWVSSSTFGAALVARARHFGAQIGVEYGEAYLCRTPLPMLALADFLRGESSQTSVPNDPSTVTVATSDDL